MAFYPGAYAAGAMQGLAQAAAPFIKQYGPMAYGLYKKIRSRQSPKVGEQSARFPGL